MRQRTEVPSVDQAKGQAVSIFSMETGRIANRKLKDPLSDNDSGWVHFDAESQVSPNPR